MKKSFLGSFRRLAIAAFPWPAVIGLTFTTAFLLSGCGGRPPSERVDVHGRIRYDDDTPIRTDPLFLVFTPATADPRTYAWPSVAKVDKTSGEFQTVTNRDGKPGLPPGKHKVAVVGPSGAMIPTALVPSEYSDGKTTPLEADTTRLPIELKVKKPVRANPNGPPSG